MFDLSQFTGSSPKASGAGEAEHLTDATFAQTLKSAGKPVVVDFFATWCGPCKMAGPVINSLAHEFKDQVLIAKVDVDENRETAQQYQVMSIPTVILFDAEGNEVDRAVGFPGEAAYRKMIQSLIAKK